MAKRREVCDCAGPVCRHCDKCQECGVPTSEVKEAEEIEEAKEPARALTGRSRVRDNNTVRVQLGMDFPPYPETDSEKFDVQIDSLGLYVYSRGRGDIVGTRVDWLYFEALLSALAKDEDFHDGTGNPKYAKAFVRDLVDMVRTYRRELARRRSR